MQLGVFRVVEQPDAIYAMLKANKCEIKHVVTFKIVHTRNGVRKRENKGKSTNQTCSTLTRGFQTTAAKKCTCSQMFNPLFERDV